MDNKIREDKAGVIMFPPLLFLLTLLIGLLLSYLAPYQLLPVKVLIMVGMLTIASSIINKEFNGIVQQCMQKLPALWLAVFTLKHVEDEATEIICKELKVTSANFWVIIHRAKVSLRASIQKNWP